MTYIYTYGDKKPKTEREAAEEKLTRCGIRKEYLDRLDSSYDQTVIGLAKQLAGSERFS
jgi:hypothetical protein